MTLSGARYVSTGLDALLPRKALKLDDVSSSPRSHHFFDRLSRVHGVRIACVLSNTPPKSVLRATILRLQPADSKAAYVLNILIDQ